MMRASVSEEDNADMPVTPMPLLLSVAMALGAPRRHTAGPARGLAAMGDGLSRLLRAGTIQPAHRRGLHRALHRGHPAAQGGRRFARRARRDRGADCRHAGTDRAAERAGRQRGRRQEIRRHRSGTVTRRSLTARSALLRQTPRQSDAASRLPRPPYLPSSWMGEGYGIRSPQDRVGRCPVFPDQRDAKREPLAASPLATSA